jgi:diguanylate cyclase (GGDEF)-like protein
MPLTHRASWPAMVHAGFAVTALTTTVAYALAGPEGRTVVYALVTAVPIITFVAALRGSHLRDRWAWYLAVVGLALLATSHLLWPDYIAGHHLGRAEMSPAALVIATAHALLMVASAAALVRHAKIDGGGIVDAAVMGLCAGGPLWEWVFRPHLVGDASSAGQTLLLVDMLLLTGVFGSLLRVAVTTRKVRGTYSYIFACLVVTILANVSAVLTVHGTSLWTAELMILGYITLAAAPLHPSAQYFTTPVATATRRPGQPRLAWLGAALCVNPLIAAVQAIRGGGGQSLLLPFGTLMVVPLVLLRFRQLSAQRAEAERTLAHHASHDELTGLYNRRHIVSEIDRALESVRRGELDGLALLLCDLDGFKPINDRLGHQAGDTVLQIVASRLAGCVRRGDVVGRLGGDEFLILCRGEPAQAVDQLRARIPTILREPMQLPGTAVTVGVTIGSAIVAADTDTTLDRDMLIGMADATMYAGKGRRGRNATARPAGQVTVEAH